VKNPKFRESADFLFTWCTRQRFPGLARRVVKPLFDIYLFADCYFAVAFSDFLIRILTMKVTRTCQFTGDLHTMDFPDMTPNQYHEAMAKWENGALIQEAFHFLLAEEREFIMTGTPPHIWYKLFSEGSDCD